MSLFEYVSVMVSVVLALGIAQILKGIGAFLVARDWRRTYWLHTIWLAFLALYHVLLWWVFWDIRSHPPDTILSFIFSVLPPALAYVLTYLLLEGRFPSNARDHFFRVRRPFFALLIGLVVCALLWPWILGYAVPASIRANQLLGVGAAAVCLFTEDRRVHGVIGVGFLLGLVWNLAVRFQIGQFTPE